MSRRSQVFTKLPWNGGLNSAVDPGVVSDNDLIQADNIQFSTSGARIKREGYTSFGTTLPAITNRESSGTTRTLTFASNFITASDKPLVVGESITIAGASGTETDDYAGTYDITATTANSISYTAAGSLAEGTTATATMTIVQDSKIIGLKDFHWWDTGNSVKQQELIAVTEAGQIFTYDTSGNRLLIAKDAGGTALSSPTKVSFEVLNETLIMGFDGTANTPKKYDPNNNAAWDDLGGTPPNFSICREYLGRIFANDKTDPDRLHYTSTQNIEEWNGTGDSGALDIFTGDGDPTGITAISEPFKTSIFIGKQTKLYELLGDAPENFKPVPLTRGLGVLSHNAFTPVGLDDLAYISARGVHSLVATDAKGDFQDSFLSLKIQNDFKTWVETTFNDMEGAYIPDLNSIAFNVRQDDKTEFDDIWLLNVESGEWYRWPDISCTALSSRLSGDRIQKLLVGTSDSRVYQFQSGVNTDLGSDSYAYTIKTGTIYPDGNPFTIKHFKALTLYYKPLGDAALSVDVKIDNLTVQTLTYSQLGEGDTLGLIGDPDFVLGTSELGAKGVFAPFTESLDGIGRGLQLTVTSPASTRPVEIYGYSIEYEVHGINQETV